MGWWGWRWLEITSLLLGAPLLSIYAAARWPSVPPQRRRQAILFAAALALVVLLSLALKLSFSSPHANMLALALAYLCYCSTAAIALRGRRWLLGAPLCLPILAGLITATVGQLMLMVDINGTVPQHDEWAAPKVRCQVTVQRHMDTAVIHKTLTLSKTLPLLPFIERQISAEQTEWMTGEAETAEHLSGLCKNAAAQLGKR
ncbi:MAG: hypothetical protein V1755_13195 [Chloroflexota bacterium]